ncbi:MAG: L-seryl-tRNA(Ser) seleniumtransferase, partial [Thermodesulfobacteriota bacterium]|nr:L-seryl-tRNA(Ser) seleniumtransferase [Thermodesulfobacteriota bacterium]
MSTNSSELLFRSIPSVDRLLSEPCLDELKKTYSHELVKRIVRLALDNLRADILEGSAREHDCTPEAVSNRSTILARKILGPKLQMVINATGVIVHTNLGRSPLSDRVVQRIAQAARSYTNLEYDLEKGKRGDRNAHLKLLMQELT